jgi:hypothetical protein
MASTFLFVISISTKGVVTMTPELVKKSAQLFSATLGLEETWVEVERLVEVLDEMLTKALVDEWELCKKLVRDGVHADIPIQTMWSYQYNFEAKKTASSQNRICVVSYEFRLCWPSESRIEYVDGSQAKIPLIIVKANNDRDFDFECYDLFDSPEELTNGNYEYQVCNRLIWDPGDKLWYAAFAVPLFAIENDADVKRELVGPVREILMLLSKKVRKSFLRKVRKRSKRRHSLRRKNGRRAFLV